MKKMFCLMGLWMATSCAQGPMGLQGPGSAPTGNSDGTSAADNSSLSNSYQADALAILQHSCASCHTDQSGPAVVYDLTNVSHLVSSGLIVVGDPDRSPLYQAITARSMPPGGALPPAEIATIRNWILDQRAAATPTPAPTPPPSSGGSTVSFKTLESTIFQPRCVACHSGMSTYNGIKRYVSTSTPTSSPLYQKTVSGQMPPSGGSLTSAQENMILQWIKAGAPNN